MPTQLERRSSTRAAILSAATDLFESNRSVDVSIDEIASAAGCTKSAVLYHFKSRIGLLSEVAKTVFTTITNQTESDHGDATQWISSLLWSVATPTGFLLYAIGDELTLAGKLDETDPYPNLCRALQRMGAPPPVEVTAAAILFFGRRLAFGLQDPSSIDEFVKSLP